MRVLFVCAGNICRSPIAEAIFRHETAFHAVLRDVEVASAGLIAWDGEGPVEHAIEACRTSLGLDIAGHQGNDFEVTDAFWRKINRVTRRFCKPDRF